MVTLMFGGYYRRFGRKYELNINSAAEGLRCLLLQIPELKESMKNDNVRIRISGKDMTTESLNSGMHTKLKDGDKIIIVPVIAGAKSGGLGMIILGVVAVAAAFWSGGASLAGYSAMVATAGVALAASGIALLLTKTPSVNTGSNSENGEANKYFSSLQNRVGQGQPVALAYGAPMVGSTIVSQGLETI
ncbi:tail assembly protein [Yersinia frederiksenii]|nr:tail assembly protein [Yersinia frederiksenii]CNI69340.1 putative phage tail protein [Yersinia frederiksenii]